MYELMSTLFYYLKITVRNLMMRQWNKNRMLGFKLKKSNFVQSAIFSI